MSLTLNICVIKNNVQNELAHQKWIILYQTGLEILLFLTLAHFEYFAQIGISL